MIHLLLDTHVLLPIIEERVHTLAPAVRNAVRSSDVRLYASVASLWEIAIKVQVGKLLLEGPLERLPDLVEMSDLRMLTIEASHVLTDVTPLPTTRDPFDRLLLAQCYVENLRLVTLDRSLVAHPLAWRPG